MTEQSQSGGPPPRTASAILSAAETLAEEIRERAYADADAIRAHAGSESEAARSAIRQRVRRLSEIADEMLGRLGEMRAELDELSGTLKGSPGGGVPVPVPASAAGAAGAAGAASEPEDTPAGVAIPESGHVRPVAVLEEPNPAAAEPLPPPASASAGVDDAGARLIALNLALSDTPRDEAARQLRNQVPDPERLVDEVYASVGR